MNALWNRVRLRYCLSRVKNRGYGLGNEMLPWARAFLAAQVLNATLLTPAFGMNRRAYWRHFRTAPDDWIQQRTLQQLLPVVEFRESDYLAHGGGDVRACWGEFLGGMPAGYAGPAEVCSAARH